MAKFARIVLWFKGKGLKMNKRKATLKDVSIRAEVSVGTVSKYINDPYSVKEKNRKKIAEAIKELDFTPNIYAQKLARGKSNTILLCIVSEKNISPSTWLHQLPVIQAMNDSLIKEGYSMQIRIVAAENQKQLESCVKGCINSREVDGIAILSAWDIPKKIVKEMKKINFPFVLLEGSCIDCVGNEVCIDNKQMVIDLVHLLKELGHEKIGFINVRSGQQDMKQRVKGYEKGMQKENLLIKEEYIMYGDFSIESGFDCVSNMLTSDDRCTALICGNDNMAVGAVKAIQNFGLSVPEDISVIGIDNSIAARACSPNLQTVQFEMGQMGRQASYQLLEQIRENECVEIRTMIPYKIIDGNSIASVKRGGEHEENCRKESDYDTL